MRKEVKDFQAVYREELYNPTAKKEEAASNSKEKEKESSMSLSTLKEKYSKSYSVYACCTID